MHKCYLGIQQQRFLTPQPIFRFESVCGFRILLVNGEHVSLRNAHPISLNSFIIMYSSIIPRGICSLPLR